MLQNQKWQLGFLYGWIWLSVILNPSLVWSFEVPALTGPIVDQVGLLSSSVKSQLETLIRKANEVKSTDPASASNTTTNLPPNTDASSNAENINSDSSVVSQPAQPVQLQVLIISSLQGISIEEAAIKIFDEWKLGTKKLDNGVLFLIAPKEKKLRIEVGRGLEGDIPDVIAKRIISEVVKPYFQRGEFQLGIAQGVSAILHYAHADSGLDNSTLSGLSDRDHKQKNKEGLGISKYIGIIIFLLWILLFFFNPSLALALLFSGRGGGGRGGGDGFGGGGWSGGGGGSSGGGASGDW